MGRPFIVLGDSTSQGGTVVGASASTDTHGRRIARVCDQVTCPKKGHGGTTVIVSGDPTMIIDGQPAASPARRYLMLNKPAGYLTTMSDPMGRPCVAELVPTDRYPGLFPVGRLDCDTTGLLLFTTNGDVGQELLHPSHHVDKHYAALVSGMPSAHDLDRLRRGVQLEEGVAAPAKVELLHEGDPLFSIVAPRGAGRTGGGEPNAVVGITIHEGRKHQVKKMMQAVGHKVLRLHRDAFGPLVLSGLTEGEWRPLDRRERELLEAVSQAREAVG